MNKDSDVDISKLYLQMKDELHSVVYTAVSVGGIYGFCVALALSNMTELRRLAVIFLGCVFGYYIGKLRKQDLYEKSLIIYAQLDLLDLGKKSLPATTPAPQEQSAKTEQATEIPAQPNLPNIPSEAVPADVKEVLKVGKTKPKTETVVQPASSSTTENTAKKVSVKKKTKA